MPTSSIAVRLCREVKAVAKRASDLGVAKAKTRPKTSAWWKPAEIMILRREWIKAARVDLIEMIPRHSWRGIQGKAHELGLSVRPIVSRAKKPKTDDPLLLALFAIIKDRNLSLNDVGEDVLGGGGTIHAWANGSYSPKLRLLRKVFDYLGLDIAIIDVAKPSQPI